MVDICSFAELKYPSVQNRRSAGSMCPLSVKGLKDHPYCRRRHVLFFLFFLFLSGGMWAVPDTLDPAVQRFREWEFARVPALRIMEGKLNTAILPAERKSEWWQRRHRQKLAEVRGKKKDTRLVFLGNSITHNLEKPGNREVWNAFFGDYDPLNLGFGGDRTENVLWRIQHGELEGLHPRLLVLLIGTNNTDAEHYPTVHTGPEVAEGIARICYEVQKRLPETKILVLGIFPYGRDPHDPRRLANEEANRLVSQLADGRKIFFLNLQDRFVDPQGHIDPSLMPDYLHPSRAGNWLWAKTMSPVVKEIIEDVYVPVRALSDDLPLKVRYKKIDSTQLYLYIWYPPDFQRGDRRPAIIFFFGGGWRVGSPHQFTKQARYLARLGMIAMTADYRVEKRDHTTPFEAVKDAKSAIRFLRSHALLLGIDPGRIVASGGSAGGHIAAAAGIVPGLEEKGEDTTVSSRPNALVLFNPVFDNGPGGYGYDRIGERYGEISPLHNIAPGDPPTILFFGDHDNLVPVSTIHAFRRKMLEAGNRCDLFLYPGQEHGFFNSWFPEYFQKTMEATRNFLRSLGYLPEDGG